MWEDSGRRTRYTNWWTHVWSNGREPNRNGDCVFKDGYKRDKPSQYGWADYPCHLDSWADRGIYALCELY